MSGPLRDLREESFRTLLESVGTIIVVLTRDLEILEMNGEAERFYGCKRENEIGKSYLTRLLPRELHARMQRDVTEVLADGSPVSFEDRATSPTGATRSIVWTISRMAGSGGVPAAAVASGFDVTELRAAERALRRRDEELEAVFRAQPDRLIQLDAKNRIRFVRGTPTCANRRAGMSSVGKPLRNAIDPQVAPMVERAAARVRAGEGVVSEGRECAGPSGPMRVEIRAVKGPDADVIVIIRDVTDLWTARRDLVSSAARYRELVERSQDIIWSIDGRSRWTFLNRNATRRILGYEPEELLHRPMSHLQVDGEPTWSVKTFRDDAEGITSETRMRRRDGSVAILRFNGVATRDDAGRVVGATGTASDITAQREAEAERRRIDAKIQEAQKLESLGVLAGGIAHDFNNLFAGILGATDLLMREFGDDSPYRRHLDIIQQASWRASELSRQMLAYAGKGRLEMRYANISELVFDTAHLIDAAISRKARLELRLTHDIPSVHGDITQLRQVIMNLITNASDSLGDQTGVITLVTRAVDEIPTTEPGAGGAPSAGVLLEVSDTGAGMDDVTRGRIFEPFFSTKFTGRGLGLAAVLGIVRAHHGVIEVDSQLGRGTRFRLYLPATDRAADSLVHQEPSYEGPVGPGLVVVVDDEPAIRAVAMHVLEGAGMTVITAADGNRALEVLEKVRHRVSLVLLDLTMPDLSGHETFRRLRRLRADLPVVATSGYDEHDTLHLFGDDPLVSFLQKPYRTSTLLACVRSAIARGRRAEAAQSV